MAKPFDRMTGLKCSSTEPFSDEGPDMSSLRLNITAICIALLFVLQRVGDIVGLPVGLPSGVLSNCTRSVLVNL